MSPTLKFQRVAISQSTLSEIEGSMLCLVYVFYFLPELSRIPCSILSVQKGRSKYKDELADIFQAAPSFQRGRGHVEMQGPFT